VAISSSGAVKFSGGVRAPMKSPAADAKNRGARRQTQRCLDLANVAGRGIKNSLQDDIAGGVIKMLGVVGPHGTHSVTGGDHAAYTFFGRTLAVLFIAAAFIGDEGQPLTVGREHAALFVEAHQCATSGRIHWGLPWFI
jgi:hypothetical protein